VTLLHRSGFLAAALSSLLSVFLASPTARAEDERPRVLVLDLEHGGGVTADDARTIRDLVTAALSRREDLEVFAGEDVRKMLELEGERQRAGCDDDASCALEIAGALDARYVVFGNASTLGGRTIVQLTLFDARSASAVERLVVKAEPAQLPERLEDAVGGLLSTGSDDTLLFVGVGLLSGGVLAGVATGVLTALGATSLDKPGALTESEYRQLQVGTLAALGVGSVLTLGLLAGGGALVAVELTE
jgi:TolB-like protein